MYYSLRGDRWTKCSAPSDFSDPVAIADANAKCDIEIIPGTGSDAWLTPSLECEWGGAVCFDFGREYDEVVQISLGKTMFAQTSFWGSHHPHVSLSNFTSTERIGMTGAINTELREFPELRVLVLEDGAIQGKIPDVFTELSRLEELSLSFQLLTGDIPLSLYDLNGLRILELDTNFFDFQISTRIAALENLEILHLQSNTLRGSIPDEVGQLSNLRKCLLCSCFYFQSYSEANTMGLSSTENSSRGSAFP